MIESNPSPSVIAEADLPFLSSVIQEINCKGQSHDLNNLADKFKCPNIVCLYQKILLLLTGRDFSESESSCLWRDIDLHRNRLNAVLTRDVGFFVAALDYLENIGKTSSIHYTFIEEGRLNALLEQSSLDGLTGLYNKKSFLMLFKKEIEFSIRKGKPFTLMMADIDNFKRINDQYGHLQGDRVLMQVADIFKTSLRAMDIAGRYGGEEFVVVFPDTTINEAEEILERIRQRIEAEFEHCVGVTVSIGITTFSDNSRDAYDLIHEADLALYQAKSQGKNNLCRHNPEYATNLS